MKRFGATNVEGSCLWCGVKLRKPYKEADGTGYLGFGHFCSCTCGWRFAVAMAENGKRLVAKKEEE